MGKLSKVLLNSILLTVSKAEEEPTFQLTSCNSDVSQYLNKSAGFHGSLMVMILPENFQKLHLDKY